MPLSWVLAIFAGFCLAVAVLLLVSAVRPVHPDLGDTLARLHRPHTGSAADVGPQTGPAGDRIGRWVLTRAAGLPGLAVPYADLDLLGMTPSRLFTYKAGFAAAGLLLPSAFGVAGTLFGLGVPWPVPAGTALVSAVGGWLFPNWAVRRDAVAARERFARSVTPYIDLVVLSRLGGAGVASAIADPAGIARAPLFLRIREALDRQRLERKAPWVALRNLADSIDLPQLKELADVVELSGTKSAPIADTLRAQARNIRNVFLNRDVETAGAASNRQRAGTVLLLVFFIAFFAAPLAIRLLNS